MVDSAVSYRYFVTDLLTNEVVAELPLTDVSYSKALKDAGDMSGSVSIGPSTSPLSLYANTMPGKSGLYVMRNGECVWGGIIWSRDYDIVGKTLNIQANEFTSYLHHRKIWKTWNLEHDGTLVYLDENNTDQYIIELNPDTNDRVSLPESTAVEIVFLDAKGYPYSGHYRVNKDLYNANKITVDKEPLQSTYQPVLDGRLKQTYLPAGYKEIVISSRTVSNGSSEVILETSGEHQLAVGDVISLNGIDGNLAAQRYATTYQTRQTAYKVQPKGNSTVLKHRAGTVSTDNNLYITNIDTTGIILDAQIEQDGSTDFPGVVDSIGHVLAVTDITSSASLTGTATKGSAQINMANTSGIVLYQIINIPGYFDNAKVTSITTNSNITVSKNAQKSGTVKIKTAGQLKIDRPVVRSGDLYVTITNRENGFSYKAVPGTKVGSLSFYTQDYEFTFTVQDDSGNEDVKSGKVKSWKDELKVGDTIEIHGVKSATDTNVDDKFFSNTSVAYPKYKVVTAIDKKTRKITFKQNIALSDFSGYVLPSAESAGNAEFNIVDVTKTKIAGAKSDTATCLNGKEQVPVIKVISKTKFVVNAECNNSPYDETKDQTVAKAVWKREYQANIHTHTDTYDQVRYLLTNVFEDFIHLEYLNPFLGNLEKYQIRTAKYDPSTDLATMTTGFIRSVYSKEIKKELKTGSTTQYELVAVVGLSTPYSQFILPSENTESNDVNEEIIVSGNDLSINGTFKIKSISSDKTKITYVLPEQTDLDSRVRAVSYPSINDSKIVFGKHNLVDGSNIAITGLTNQNYDGSFSIREVPDEVTFTYKPKFELLVVSKVSIGQQRNSDSKYPVTLYLSKKPNDAKYAYIPSQTKITISNMGLPYDGTFVISSQDFEADEPSITYLVSSATPHAKRDADYASRKYGDVYSVSTAQYVRAVDSKGITTGNGTVTYKTSSAHPYSAGDTVIISNIGSVFTQKTGSSNAYSEIIVPISTTPNNTSFTTNNQGLFGVNYNTENKTDGKSNSGPLTVTSGSVRYYDPSGDKTNSLPPTVKIDDLPDVLSPIKNKVNITDRAFNKDDRMVYLQLSSNPGLYKGGTIVVDGVDGPNESIFDGVFTVNSIKKWTDNKWQVSYQSGNRKQKKDLGSFKDITPKDKSKVRTFQAYENNSGGTLTQESWVYVGSYGSYPGSSDIGIEFSTQAYSGHYMRSDRYKGHELKTVGEALATYADKFITRPGSTKSIRNIYGFDYRINCVYDYNAKSFRRIFTFIPVHYPNEPVHGETSPISRFGADKVVFEYPGNIQSVSLKESSENASTRFWMVGSDGGTGTEDATKTYVGVAAKNLLNTNWPIIEAENSDDKLDFLVDISDRAYRYLSETQPPTGEFTVTVNGSLDPIVNTYQPSDWCSIIVNDPFVKERLLSDLEPRETVIVRKITAYTVEVPNNPSFPEQVSLTLIPEWDVDKRGQ
jgi:hypothetical protein